MPIRVLPLLFFLPLLIPCESGRRLNIFVRHFEPLSYNHRRVHASHIRVKRSLSNDNHVHVRFRAHNRVFHLRLTPDASVFHRNLVVQTATKGAVPADVGHIYTGKISGEPDSYVYGALHDGVFEGGIDTSNGSYYVESARKYFERPTSFHSVLYADHDVEHPNTGRSWCGLRGETERWMNHIAEQRNNHFPPVKYKWRRHKRLRRHLLSLRETTEDAVEDTSWKEIPTGGNGSDERNVNWTKRVGKESRRVCNLEVVVDHLLFGKFLQPDGDHQRAEDRLTAMIAAHMVRVNNIYRNTDFNGVRDISIAVQQIKINDSTDCIGRKAESNPFCTDNLDISKMLHLVSTTNHEDFCLSQVWTYRDFADGVMGLAWVAKKHMGLYTTGGICERYTYSLEKSDSRTVVTDTVQSLNTGIISFLNFNHFVPLFLSEISVAHEIGHSYGSPHDTGPDCAPNGPDGHYLMYPTARRGNLKNNRKLSPCSVNNISVILDALIKGEGGREDCFQEDSGPICGNHIREGDEKCDCGADEGDCKDICCHPRNSVTGNNGCTLTQGSVCSPTTGPCCTQDCKYTTSETVCMKEGQCTYEVTCSGQSEVCPDPITKPDKTECYNNTQVCKTGECTGSICENYGLEECMLNTKDHDEQCLVACKKPNSSEDCLPTCKISSMAKLCGLKMMPGSPCDDMQGFCDVFLKCRPVDAEGPLSRVRSTIFGRGTPKSFRSIVADNLVLFIVLLMGFLGLVAAVIQCFAVHLPSNHPLKPAHKFRDTLSHPLSAFSKTFSGSSGMEATN